MENRTKISEEDRKVYRIAMMLIAASTVILLGSFFLVYYDKISIHAAPENIDSFNNNILERLLYTFKYQTLLIFWLLFNVLATIFVRIRSMSIDPLNEDTESHPPLVGMKNILTNSLESIFICVMSQIIYVCFAHPVYVLKFIPLVNYLVFIGRITYMLGYPMKRSFGYHLTGWPNIALNVYNLYKFGSFAHFY